jgi:hypothetical protein
MSIAEQAHAFHVTRAALHTISLPPNMHLETFGSYMNCSAVPLVAQLVMVLAIA